MTQMLMSTLMLAGIWAISDFIAVKTKAFLSMTFVAFALLLIGTWSQMIPSNIVETAGLTSIATLAIPLVLVHMGSTMNLDQIKAEWRTLFICVGGMLTLVGFMFTVGLLVLDKETAITATPVIYGGGVAAMILTSVLEPMGLKDLIGFAWLLTAVQLFIGIPLSLFFLKRFARSVIEKNQIAAIANTLQAQGEQSQIKELLPAKYQTSFILLFFGIALGTVGMLIGQFTQAYGLHPYIVCLLLAFAATRFGIIPANLMVKANAYGFLMFGLFVYIGIQMTSSISLEVFLNLIEPALLSFLVAIPGLGLGAIIVARMIKVDMNLALALVYSCLSGFPTTIILAEEVSTVTGRTEEEVNTLKAYLVPKMLIAGLVTVTVLSGLLASLLVKFL